MLFRSYYAFIACLTLTLSFCLTPAAKCADLTEPPVQGIESFADAFGEFADSSERLSAIKPLTATVKLPGAGRTRLTLDTKWNPQYAVRRSSGSQLSGGAPTLLRGSARVRGRNLPIALNVLSSSIEGRYAEANLLIAAPHSGRLTAYGLKIKLLTAKSGRKSLAARLTRTPLSKFAPDACGNNGAGSHAAAHAADLLGEIPSEEPKTNGAVSQRSVLELAADADWEFVDLYAQRGVSAADLIAAIINDVAVIYRAQLGVEIDLRMIHLFDQAENPYNTLLAEYLIQQFSEYTRRANHLGHADLFHLFTGKDLDKNTIGIAYTGGLCTSSSARYGLTQAYYRSLMHIITAHEIGHNFGAQHDNLSGNSIMTTQLDPGAPPAAFSATSINQMNEHLKKYGQCLHVSGSAVQAILGDISAEAGKPGSYRLRFLLNDPQSDTPNPEVIELYGRSLVNFGAFELIWRSDVPIYGIAFSANEPAQYMARISGDALSSSAVLTVPSAEVRVRTKLRLAARKNKPAQLLSRVTGPLAGAASRAELLYSATGGISAFGVVTAGAATANTDFAFRVSQKGVYIVRWYYPESDTYVQSNQIRVNRLVQQLKKKKRG